MPLPLRYSARNLWRRRHTTLATSAGVALVVFVLASSLMLVNGVRATLLRSGQRDTAIVMQQSATAEVASTLRQGVLGLVAAAPGVQPTAAGGRLASSELVRSILVPTRDGSRLVSLQVRGVSSNVAELRPGVHVVSGRRATAGTDEAMIGAALLGRYRGLELGGEVEMNKGRKLQLVGVFEAQGAAFESEIWADLHSVQTTTESDGYISSVTARAASRSPAPTKRAAAGEAAIAMPPRPIVSTMAESPRSGFASSGPNPGKKSPCGVSTGAVNQRGPHPATRMPNCCNSMSIPSEIASSACFVAQ